MASSTFSRGLWVCLLSCSFLLQFSCSRRTFGRQADGGGASQAFTLESVRDSLERQEDTIVFCLIERAKYPDNSPVYTPSGSNGYGGAGGSLVESFARESEAAGAKFGRYENPEEVPFFSGELPLPLEPPYNFSQILYPAAKDVNVSRTIWDTYIGRVLPLITTNGEDGNYASTAAADLVCLQALSRRIHYGRFVAEVKFLAAPGDYGPAIRAKDRVALEKLLTSVAVEEAVRRRVEKKAMVFGQNVTLDGSGGGEVRYKVDPVVASRVYGEWVIPLTKLVEVEYLLRRLD